MHIYKFETCYNKKMFFKEYLAKDFYYDDFRT